MRSSVRTSYVASALLGSTLVYAVPQRLEMRSLERRLDPAISVVGGEADPNSPYVPNAAADSPTVSADAVATSTNPTNANPTPAPNPDTTASPTHDTVTDASTTSDSIRSMSGTSPNTLDTAYTALASSSSTFNVASAPSVTPSLAPEPTVDSNGSGRGVLTGVVAGGLVLAFLLLTAGLWFCYRRRGPRSGSSTPIYTTRVVSGDESDNEKRPNPIIAFFRGRSSQWKKGHHRVQSSMSFASPMIENEPKMVNEQGSFAYTQAAPLPPHLGGGVGAGSMRDSARGSGSAKSGGGNTSSARDTWNNGRWSTFSTSDGSVYPQTPTNNRLSGVIMETVVETDATSLPQTPTIAARSPPIDYADLKRTSNDVLLNRTPKKTTSLVTSLPPLGTNRLSMFREEDTATPTTPTSSGGLTFGSGSNYARTIDRNSHPVPPPPALGMYGNGNGSGSLRSGGPLVNAVPKFNPAHSNGSGGSLNTSSTGRESNGTIRITNPFLDDEDGLSSYGHGMVDDTAHNDDSRSIRTMDSDAFGAYPSSTGCIDNPTKRRPGQSPSPDAPPTRPRSSLISDASSDYPYPLGYAVDSDGNVANPFLRISEILEEVDGRMRWPSPPLLPRAESRNY
ncbi:hypothetical protein M408DRAFT_29574 [Serendipita vermifera MAFF 305830]|uniref:Uncharacterized protein n=1 Tax=Serendipita vermifera MAFF 305830 TaxID=933852 RepID=A0A0C3A9W9_SERVB|nr:hypothetical protein M408DRAFT_29574 [Serendipita vermifera MAFF 305830]